MNSIATAHRDTVAAPAPSPWLTICRFDDLEPGWGEAALVAGRQLAIIRVPDGTDVPIGAVFAVSNEDPATGSFVMSRGIVGSKAGRPTLASPLHKQVYDLQSGECYSNPELAIETFAVRVRAGVVEVLLDLTEPSAGCDDSVTEK